MNRCEDCGQRVRWSAHFQQLVHLATGFHTCRESDVRAFQTEASNA